MHLTEKQFSDSIFKYLRFYESYTGFYGFLLRWVPMNDYMLNKIAVCAHNRAARRMAKLNERFPDTSKYIEA